MGVSGILSNVLPVDYRAGDRFAQSDEMARYASNHIHAQDQMLSRSINVTTKLVIVLIARLVRAFAMNN